LIRDEKIMMVVEEYVSGRSMKSVLTSDQVSSEVRVAILFDVATALLYLHDLEPAVAHGDLKPGNILLHRTDSSTSLKAKLIDFGLSRIVTPLYQPMGGSWKYMAPEIVLDFASKDSEYLSKDSTYCASDMFSYGRTVYFVVTSKEPLKDSSAREIIDAVQKGAVLPGLEWPDKPAPWQLDCQRLSELCLCSAPHDRATSKAVFDMLQQWSGIDRFTARNEDGQADIKTLANQSSTPSDPISAFQDIMRTYIKTPVETAPVASLQARDAVISHLKLSL